MTKIEFFKLWSFFRSFFYFFIKNFNLVFHLMRNSNSLIINWKWKFCLLFSLKLFSKKIKLIAFTWHFNWVLISSESLKVKIIFSFCSFFTIKYCKQMLTYKVLLLMGRAAARKTRLTRVIINTYHLKLQVNIDVDWLSVTLPYF